MMRSSVSLHLFFLIIGCSLVAINAELSPFYDYRLTLSDEKNDNKSLDKTEERKPLKLRSRNLSSGYGDHHSHITGRYGEKHYYEAYDCESFYSKSHKKQKSSKKEKHYKQDKKKCKGVTNKHRPEDDDDSVMDNPIDQKGNYKDFVRFIMVREEAGTPSSSEFGIGDTLALNGQVYYWEDYEDNLISGVPAGSFVTLCTGISSSGDLMCTYEIVLGILTHKNKNGNPVRGTSSSVSGVGAIVANGPNYMSENQMIVTGTEFEFSEYKGGTLITQEDLVNPYLYADLYLL
mmetsp:Transcript_9253/g.19410  ORF Transcript_9253/g.19410 Transcript_9253/m.19410 type:complete len:290 (-) Transcript_9253:142-1011(-)|eukprot:CAMPEP_0201164038 /NCGR_PEP_ID=MMETSP0851-20130426/59205_1 /ASSEMBLY_ACC=CAM_ASM_000631 /TAXON_ID=183588 /ORGANISM="Pseudo-nitzschia fraudulenta, Strain WWA7" /LENGTH=289 /DNA_ID=CAMNT_0047444361 /DNA_START=90 /DNA_END=959 /DNA_ORIENTATION=+